MPYWQCPLDLQLRTNVQRLSDTSGLVTNPANREITSSSGRLSTKTFFFLDFFSIFFSKNLEKYDLTDPKCLNVHSHLDLKSLSFSTESTNVLLPTP
jgi:hypothetical protein